jgi:hypothetical protein
MLGLLEIGEVPYVHTPVAREERVLLRIPLDDMLAALDTHRDLTMELVVGASRMLLPGPHAASAGLQTPAPML